jgi:hypothetical protein
MKHILFIVLILLTLPLQAQKVTASDILKAVDKNMVSTTSVSTTRMVVNSQRASRTIGSINYSQGNDKFYSEYTSPPREKGTKMLKLGSDLWIFDPNTDRSVQISGNMLKQSVMGSDLSYEDFMEESKLFEDYDATIQKETTYDKRDCWVLVLTARRTDIAYYKRTLYVDKQRYISLYEEWYAKSGKLLKTVKATDVRNVQGRWYPHKIVFKDQLKSGKGTEYYIDKMEVDLPIAKHIFTKAMLK